MQGPRSFRHVLFSFDLDHLIGLYLVAFFYIIIVLEYKSTFISRSYFFYIVLESLQRCKRTVKHNDTVTDQTG